MITWTQVEILFITLVWFCLDGVQVFKTEDITNVCLDGRHHKSKPGPEDNLFSMCAPWSKRSCCTGETSKGIHLSDAWLNFNWNHCGWLSPLCREQFIQDLCFYECSPNLGPWLVKVDMKIRNQTQRNVPLCQSVCTNWWNDCKNDLTCKADWSKGFNWTSGTNTCPAGSQCRPFHQVYPNANAFCEQVWGHAWKVVPDSEPCMYTWFDPKHGNPNDKVALKQAMQLVNGSELSTQSYAVPLFMLFVFFYSLLLL